MYSIVFRIYGFSVCVFLYKEKAASRMLTCFESSLYLLTFPQKPLT